MRRNRVRGVADQHNTVVVPVRQVLHVEHRVAARHVRDRGSDIAHTPVVLAFALVPKDGRPALYVDPGKVGAAVRERLETLADVRADEEFERDLAALGAAHKAVRLDPAGCPEAIARLVTGNGGTVIRGGDLIVPMKAVKNMISVPRNNHIPSFPFGIGMPIFRVGAVAVCVMSISFTLQAASA